MASAEQQFIPYTAVDCVAHGRVLVLAPHPDDEILGCGGAIVHHIQAGDPVRVVVVTDGAYGARDRAEDYALAREQESLAASKVLGYGAPNFWRLPDRSLEYGEFLIQRILRTIDEDQSDIVYAPSWWEIHPDHLALAMATVEAVRRSLRPLHLAMYEVGVPLHPNTLLDITDVVERKQAAVACFPSQLAQQRYDEHIAGLNRFRTYTLPASVVAAEAYRTVTQTDLCADPLTMIRPGVYYGQTGRQEDAAPPLVSVIVRSIDRPQLVDALDSIALQTYQNIEIVLVDAKGHCHSNVPGWCGRFPIREVSSDTPLSRARAANVGMDNARGKYCIFLDDDDIFYPDHIAGLVRGLQDRDGLRAAYSAVRVEYFVEGELVRTGTFQQPFNLVQLRGRNYIPNNAVLFERSLCDIGCRFDEMLTVLEDWDFWLQLSLHTTFLYLDQVSACYRNGGHSGFGSTIPEDYLLTTTGAVFAKWKSLWSGQDLAEILLHRDAMVELSHQEIRRLQQDLTDRERLVQDHEQARGSLESRLSTHEDESTRQRSDNSTLRRELAGQENQMSDAATRIADLEQAIADLRQSTTWRVTAPMRFVVAFFRRGRN
jgi:LmbE family N-acetylglucosaminyl deacetylase